MDTIRVRAVIPGEPVAQGRPRAFRTSRGQVRAYDPAKSRSWKAEARTQLAAAVGVGWTLLAGPISCHIVAVFSCPRSQWRKREPWPQRHHAKRPDVENVAKAVLDSASGVIWLDDAQVTRLEVEKVIGAQGEAPRVEILIEALA
jgi:Holliday junction resolvase RusA-like endonuclease